MVEIRIKSKGIEAISPSIFNGSSIKSFFGDDIYKSTHILLKELYRHLNQNTEYPMQYHLEFEKQEQVIKNISIIIKPLKE